MACHLLLSGGSGLIGGVLVPLLRAARPDREITLIGRRPQAPDLPGVRWLSCDLASDPIPDLSITEVIHCAADVRFRLPLEDALRANTHPTQKLIEYASKKGVQKFTHVSTAYVAGALEGDIREEALTPHRFLNTYQESKWEAERSVMASDLPWKICRLSSVLGNARQPSYLQGLIRIAPRSPFPVLPADPEARVDLIPAGYAGRALAWLHENDASRCIYHITAGPKASIRAVELLERVFTLARRPMPRLGPLAEFEAYAEGLTGPARELPAVLRPFLPHLTLRQHFLNCRTRSALAGSGLGEPDVRPYFDRFVRDCWSSPA